MTIDDLAREVVTRIEHGDEKHRQWLRETATPLIAEALREMRYATKHEAVHHCVAAARVKRRVSQITVAEALEEISRIILAEIEE